MKIIVTESIAKEGIEQLKNDGFEVDVRFGISAEELLDIIQDYDGKEGDYSLIRHIEMQDDGTSIMKMEAFEKGKKDDKWLPMPLWKFNKITNNEYKEIYNHQGILGLIISPIGFTLMLGFSIWGFVLYMKENKTKN